MARGCRDGNRAGAEGPAFESRLAHWVTPGTLGRSSQGRPYDPRHEHRDVHPRPHRIESGRHRRGPRRGGGHRHGDPTGPFGRRDRRGLRQTPGWRVAHDLRPRRRPRHVLERLRPGRAAVQADSGAVPPGADPVRAAVCPHAGPRAGALRLAGSGRGQGIPPRPRPRARPSDAVKPYLITSGALFGLIAAAHLWEVIDRGRLLALDLLVFAVSGSLCFWAWWLLRTASRNAPGH